MATVYVVTRESWFGDQASTTVIAVRSSVEKAKEMIAEREKDKQVGDTRNYDYEDFEIDA